MTGENNTSPSSANERLSEEEKLEETSTPENGGEGEEVTLETLQQKIAEMALEKEELTNRY